MDNPADRASSLTPAERALLEKRLCGTIVFPRAELRAGRPRGAPRPNLLVDFVPPRTEVERAVAQIWEEVLGLGPVGVYDDFFALGGHSLHAVQVAARIGERLGGEVSAHSLFDAPTIADLAERLGEDAGPAAPEDLAALLDRLDSLSEEEAARLLADLQAPPVQ